MEKRKTLKEIAQEKGKHLFIESFSVTIPSSNIEVLASGGVSLVESFQGEKFKAVAIVRSVPVTRFTENLNGRVYSEELWRNVYKTKVAEGTLCLADHPGDDSDGSVKDIVGVWRNFKVNESNCTADLYLVGKHGQHFLEVLQAGGKNGLSTVGFGELMEDERTVNPRTYELIRLSDWVLTPSQGVYAEQDNIDSNSVSMSESVKGRVESHTNIIREEKTKQEEVRNHNMGKDNIQGLTVRNNVKVALKESERAKQNKGASLIEAKREIEDTLELIPEDFGSERTKLVEEIATLDALIKSEIKENSEKLKVSEETLTDLKEKVKTSDVMLTKVKEQLTKSKDVIKSFSEQEKALKTDINSLVEDTQIMQKDINDLVEDINTSKSNIDKLISERGTLLKDIRQSLAEKLVMLEDISRLKKENKELKSKVVIPKTLTEDEIEQPDVMDMDLVQDQAYSDEDYGLVVDPAIAYGADDEDYGGPAWDEYNDQSGYLEDKKPVKNKMTESKNSAKKINRDVLNFYNERVVSKPVLKKIKEGILAQPNLVQASKYIEKFFKQEDEKPFRISESRMNPGQRDWIGDNHY